MAKRDDEQGLDGKKLVRTFALTLRSTVFQEVYSSLLKLFLALCASKTTTFIGLLSSPGRSRPWQPASPLASSSTPHTSSFPSSSPTPVMSDEKKRDFAIELGDKQSNGHYDNRSRSRTPAMQQQSASMRTVVDNPLISILTYCGSSILMTVANKYVVSGTNFNLNFFLLAVQVCIAWNMSMVG